MNVVIAYLRSNWFYVLAISYMCFSCVLKIATGINITIPCMVHVISGYHCPGCGLTAAAMQLMQLNFQNAWSHNPLIYFVIPGGITYIIFNFLGFRKKKLNPAFIH